MIKTHTVYSAIINGGGTLELTDFEYKNLIKLAKNSNENNPLSYNGDKIIWLSKSIINEVI